MLDARMEEEVAASISMRLSQWTVPRWMCMIVDLNERHVVHCYHAGIGNRVT